MHKLELPIFATLSLCAGPFLFIQSFRDFRLRRLIQNTPTARIRSMAMGLAEVNGTVAANSVLSAPFSGQTCAYWEVDIAIPARRRTWTTVHRNASGHPFYVEDDTGVALIYPRGAQCKVRFAREEECMGVALPECYASYMSDQGLALRHVWRLGPMRFRERLLEEGQRVYVLGTAEPRAQSFTISEGEVLKATGTDGRPEPHQRTLQRTAVAVIRRGTDEPSFIISQESERELVIGMGFQVLGKLVAGPLLTLIGIGLWAQLLSSGGVFP